MIVNNKYILCQVVVSSMKKSNKIMKEAMPVWGEG